MPAAARTRTRAGRRAGRRRHGKPSTSAARRVGDDVADVAAAVLTRDQRRHVSARLTQLGRHLQDRDRPPGAHIERREAVEVRLDGRHVGRGDVVDVDEVPHLAAVLENPWHIARFELERKIAATPGVRGVARHVRPVDIVIAQRDHRTAR